MGGVFWGAGCERGGCEGVCGGIGVVGGEGGFGGGGWVGGGGWGVGRGLGGGGLTCRDDRKQSAFACIGHANDAHICNKLQLQLQPRLAPLLPKISYLRSPARCTQPPSRTCQPT